MVNLLEKSNVDPKTNPIAYQWDSLVRKNFSKYQHIIDAKTYQAQRTQRLLFAWNYPKGYNSDLITLNLIKAKQSVGQVTQQQVDLYKNIDSGIASDFNKTFSSRLPIPYIGLGVGGSLFMYTTYFNSTMPTRIMLLVVPSFIDFLIRIPDSKIQHRVTQFLDWVIGYRKAKAFAEKYKGVFNNEQTKKIFGQSQLPQLGRQLVNLASK